MRLRGPPWAGNLPPCSPQHRHDQESATTTPSHQSQRCPQCSCPPLHCHSAPRSEPKLSPVRCSCNGVTQSEALQSTQSADIPMIPPHCSQSQNSLGCLFWPPAFCGHIYTSLPSAGKDGDKWLLAVPEFVSKHRFEADPSSAVFTFPCASAWSVPTQPYGDLSLCPAPASLVQSV